MRKVGDNEGRLLEGAVNAVRAALKASKTLRAILPEGGAPKLRRARVEHEGLAEPVKIGWVTDLHLGWSTRDEFVRQAFELLAKENPEAVFIGGDLVDDDAEEASRLSKTADPLDWANSKRFVLRGNHDIKAAGGWAVVEGHVRECGFIPLVNETVRLSGAFGTVRLDCLDDPTQGSPNLAGLDGGAGSVLLCHAPEIFSWGSAMGLDANPNWEIVKAAGGGWEDAKGRRRFQALPGAEKALKGRLGFTLALFGHTHGGQIMWAGKRALDKRGHSRRHMSGLERVGAEWECGGFERAVSAGAGNSGLPLRIGVPPEAWTIELVPAGWPARSNSKT